MLARFCSCFDSLLTHLCCRKSFRLQNFLLHSYPFMYPLAVYTCCAAYSSVSYSFYALLGLHLFYLICVYFNEFCYMIIMIIILYKGEVLLALVKLEMAWVQLFTFKLKSSLKSSSRSLVPSFQAYAKQSQARVQLGSLYHLL